MIKGETVILLEKTQTGTDPFNRPIYEEVGVEVKNVIVGSPTFDEVATEMNISGKMIAFILGIPKGDNHSWKDVTIFIRGQKFKSYGFPMTQTEENVPGRWNTQVKVVAYE